MAVWPFAPRPHVARFGTYKLVYRVLGSGPPVVLVHGLSGSGHWWKRNIAEFAQHFSVYVVELVGYGNNRSWRPVKIETTAEALARFVATLPGGRAHLVGHSMGGHIATHLAARFPERVDRLVLASASGMVNTNLVKMALRLPGEGRRAAFDFAPVLAFDALRAGPLNLLLSTLDILSNDVSDALATIAAPTLLVWGTNDVLVPLAVGEAVLKHLPPGTRLELIEGAGHVVMWDRADEFNRHVMGFLLAP